MTPLVHGLTLISLLVNTTLSGGDGRNPSKYILQLCLNEKCPRNGNIDMHVCVFYALFDHIGFV